MPRRDYSSAEIDLALTAFAVEAGLRKQTERLLREGGIKVPFGTLRNWAYRTHEARYQQIKAEVSKRVGVLLADDFHRLARTSTELSEDILRRIRETLERKDREFAAADERLRDAERRLAEIDTMIELDRRELASSIDIPDVDSLIEEILSDPGDLELPREAVLRLNGANKRRTAIAVEVKEARARRVEAEVGFKELAKLLHESAVMGGVSTEKLALLTGQATDRVEHSFPELQRALEAKGIRLALGQGPPRELAPIKVAAVVDVEAKDG